MVEPGHLAKQHDGPVGVRHAGRGDGDGDQQAEGIDQDVTLAAQGLLAAVVAPLTPGRGRLGRRAVHRPGRRVGVTTGPFADDLPEGVVDPPPGAVTHPPGVVM